MNCSTCRSPLLHCNCHDADKQIIALIASPAGRKLAHPLYNALVWRAAVLIDRRIVEAQNEFFNRFPDVDRRQYRPRKRYSSKNFLRPKAAKT